MTVDTTAQRYFRAVTRFNRADNPEERQAGAVQVRELMSIESHPRIQRQLAMYLFRIGQVSMTPT